MQANDLTLLHEAALEAGRIALRYWKHAPDSWDKGDGAGPVSEADLAVNAMLEAELRAARPDYGWLSEESVDDPARLAAKHSFIVDPIDGTRAFLNGDGGFAHALAVTEGHRVVAGIVHLPVHGLTYSATLDGPALLNGKPLTPSQRADLIDAKVLTSKLSDNPMHWRAGEVPAYKRTLRSSLAWRLCLVAEGRFDATISLRAAWEWDIAAASLIAERAGLRTSDRNGAALRFNEAHPQADGIVVANAPLHQAFLDAIKPVPQ
ncbi:inositol monophosphatase [Thioclava dalianensis]|uniref:Inositol monophosphatase n=1 Tax=Thioclava dalianensis TaxID=1185766 RepID=A0A074TJI3_9RHOB|nr:3'(2'),5'-bisphosphate nucleotidase CysQ [Thioclava dalianensis]KEP70310.1 inositol monophosphatase [Thioclava dalianensis]SFN33715.1 myo-inositol-1(or 4)-monophosphatase [Thioclava dalianensis]